MISQRVMNSHVSCRTFLFFTRCDVVTSVIYYSTHTWKNVYPGFGDFTYLKSSDAHEQNCNISCQSKNFIFKDFFAVKVNGSDVNPGICAGFSYRQIPGLTSYPSTLTAKKYMKMNFSADKIGCNFSHEYLKISNM